MTTSQYLSQRLLVIWNVYHNILCQYSREKYAPVKLNTKVEVNTMVVIVILCTHPSVYWWFETSIIIHNILCQYSREKYAPVKLNIKVEVNAMVVIVIERLQCSQWREAQALRMSLQEIPHKLMFSSFLAIVFMITNLWIFHLWKILQTQEKLKMVIWRSFCWVWMAKLEKSWKW